VVSVRVVPWIVILVCAFVSSASADDDRRAREVASAIDAGAYGEGYRLAKELVAERPGYARAHELASIAALETYRFLEAQQHLDKALRVRPGDPGLLGRRAAMRLGIGDEAGARADAELAVTALPDEPLARAVLDDLVLTDRASARLAGADPGLPPGSGAAFVDTVLAAFARRDQATVADSFDPTFLDDMRAVLTPAAQATSSDHMRSFVAGVFDSAEAAASRNGQEIYGWVIAADETVEDNLTWIDVQLPSRVTYSREQIAMFAAVLADPKARESTDPTMRARYDGVSAEERPSLLERMVGTSVRSVVPVRFGLVRRGAQWRIAEVLANGVSMKRLMGNVPRIAGAALPSASSGRRDPGALYAVGGVAAVGAALFALIVYLQRRDAAERRWRRERARR
jgi:hypothetical protein